MSSETSVAAEQCRLQEWAAQIRDCQSRPAGMSIVSWCACHGITKANYYYRLRRVSIATKGSEKYYLQSAFAMPTADKINQEQGSLLSISDSFRKIIVVGNHIKVRRDENGILIVGLRNFLLDENSLRL